MHSRVERVGPVEILLFFENRFCILYCFFFVFFFLYFFLAFLPFYFRNTCSWMRHGDGGVNYGWQKGSSCRIRI